MKNWLLPLLCCFPIISFSQKDAIEFSKEEREKIHYASGSAFMQFSNFIPSNFKEVLIAISGNERTDSLLLNANTDTLSQGGPLFFDYYIRRDFGLESIFSPTVQYFAGKKIYDTQAIKATIVWAYYNFLKGEPISFQSIRKKVIKHYRGPNSKAKRRLKKQLKKYKGEIRST